MLVWYTGGGLIWLMTAVQTGRNGGAKSELIVRVSQPVLVVMEYGGSVFFVATSSGEGVNPVRLGRQPGLERGV